MSSKYRNEAEEPLAQPLVSRESEDFGGFLPIKHRTLRRRFTSTAFGIINWVVILPWTMLVILSIWVFVQYQRRGPSNPIFPQALYSPIEKALEYEIRSFRLGLNEDKTEFQGPPSPELDKAWTDLYDMGINLIPIGMAAKLPNRTIIFPHDEQRRYVIELDVFHELHCLNMIRKTLHPEYYKPQLPGPNGGEDELFGPSHIDHCVDTIRQSLMCTADVSVIGWYWDHNERRHVPQGTNQHTCRKFDKIQEWARLHAVYTTMDTGYRELNDPLDPDTWITGDSRLM